MQFSVYIKNIDWTTTHVYSIHPTIKTIEVWLTGPDEGDPIEYSFDEVIISRPTGVKDKNGVELYENDKVEIFGMEAIVRFSAEWCGWVFYNQDMPEGLNELPFYDGEKGNYLESIKIGIK